MRAANVLPYLALTAVAQAESLGSPRYNATCLQIAQTISSASQVFYPPSPEYAADIKHWVVSSSMASACSVEPGNAADVGHILRVLSATRTPFAVKGGGHTTNPGFSSTEGVQIAMTRFRDIVTDEAKGSVEVGAGLTWSEVYEKLDAEGKSVVGGRYATVGVAGLTLGGGYAWISSEYGLTVDNVLAYELVLPSGEVTRVTEEDEDLWFALRGGGNNFGIVTKFVFKLVPQGDIWAAIVVIAGEHLGYANEAISKFLDELEDKKVALIGGYGYAAGQLSLGLQLFYNAPEPPTGLFDSLLGLPSNVTYINGSFIDFVKGLGTHRALFGSIPMFRYSPAVLSAITNETEFWGRKLSALDKDVQFLYSIEPFDRSLFAYGAGSAYPPDRTHTIFPGSIDVQWTDPAQDDAVVDAVHQSSAAVRAAAEADGQPVGHAARYPNYALAGTQLKDMYGANVPRLQHIQQKYDPKGVMDLAGGFKF
ncbi:hypothetical protein BC834DRAFT_832532 [Gloeopeniophorella convolvens]|nr:hypothetical protein BC834DRAFT_832532 [Gloeopeniophorella convolvens]